MDNSDRGAEYCDLKGLVGTIVAAYVAHNAVPASEVPKLIVTVHAALTDLASPKAASDLGESLSPAEIRTSIRPDALISFLDGKPYKTLKRHIGTHGLSPADYRARFGLPHDYPMTCTRYSETRAAFARRAGLGQHAVNSGSRTAAAPLGAPLRAARRP